jgi:hypothetical protein
MRQASGPQPPERSVGLSPSCSQARVPVRSTCSAGTRQPSNALPSVPADPAPCERPRSSIGASRCAAVPPRRRRVRIPPRRRIGRTVARVLDSTSRQITRELDELRPWSRNTGTLECGGDSGRQHQRGRERRAVARPVTGQLQQLRCAAKVPECPARGSDTAPARRRERCGPVGWIRGLDLVENLG